MVEEWRKWATSLLDLNKFFIPCGFNPEVVRSRGVGLHVFAYASVSAFGAIAYLCFNHTDRVKIAFIMRRPGRIVQICIDYLARIMHRPSSCRSQHPSRTKSAKKLIKQLSGRIRLPFWGGFMFLIIVSIFMLGTKSTDETTGQKTTRQLEDEPINLNNERPTTTT
jgi:hypothetical protein